MAGGNDLIYECWPVVRPLLLKDRDENKVQLIQEGTIDSAATFVVRELDDEVDDEIPDTCPLQRTSI